MIQGRDDARFAFESLSYFGEGSGSIGQYFDRDCPVQTRITGFVDLSHSARAQRRKNLVRSQTSAAP